MKAANRIITNSYYEKSSEPRQILGLDTEEPYITPQKYNMVEKTSFGTVTSYNYHYDGQFFTRDKKHGGNGKSSWAISGRGLTNREIAVNSREFEKFKTMFDSIDITQRDPSNILRQLTVRARAA